MDFRDLTDEQKAKARSAKSAEDLLALAKEEGFELSDSDVEAISGGMTWSLDCSDVDVGL